MTPSNRLIVIPPTGGVYPNRDEISVCGTCISDRDLAAALCHEGTTTKCHFCGTANTHGTKLGVLFTYMATCLVSEWSYQPNSGEWIMMQGPTDSIDSHDLLRELESPLADTELQRAFITAFPYRWYPREPARPDPYRCLSLSWSQFCRTTRTHQRFFFYPPDSTTEPDYREQFEPVEVPQQIGEAILRARQHVLGRSTNISVFGARTHPLNRRFDTASQLGSAPPGSAGNNRMSPQGISMFYGADSDVTAFKEVQPSENEAVTIARWNPSREILYLDLPAARPVPSIFHQTARTLRSWLRFLADFGDAIAQPATIDSPEIEYIPTQIITEYIRDHLRLETEPIIAIRYQSAIDPNGKCWVMFADQDDCADYDNYTSQLLILHPDSVKRYEPGMTPSEPVSDSSEMRGESAQP